MSYKPNNNERTPLLNGLNGESSNGNQNHILGDVHRERSAAFQFFFDSKHTPGNDSDNFVVRSLAYTWHVTKVTLLSSKFCARITILPLSREIAVY